MPQIAKLGAQSRARLATCHPDIVRVINRAEAVSPVDFTILCGHRTLEEQAALYAQGRTKPGPIVTNVDGVNRSSEHNYDPSRAIDLVAWPIPPADQGGWDNPDFINRCHVVAGAVMASAAVEGVELRWGADWDRDGDLAEHRFVDLPHFELAR